MKECWNFACGCAGAVPTRKDVLYLLDNRDDPEVDASIKAFLRAQYQNPKAEAPRVADGLELTAKVEKKYYAAQVVEFGLQVRSKHHNIKIGHSSYSPADLLWL